MNDLLTIDAAETLIGEALRPFPTETIPLGQAAGRILRQNVTAERALPPYDRVILDGIAVAWRDGQRDFRLVATQPAGRPPLAMPDGTGQAIAVMTGSVLPAGADTIIPREDFDIQGNLVSLRADVTPRRNQHVHPKGADCAQGAALLSPGLRLTPPEMAVLAANGISHPEVSVIPSIAIISTGDELVAPDAPVQDWQIRRSNEFAIAASLSRKGFTRQVFAVLPDDLALTTDHLATLLEQHDVLVLSGGVSMGQFDFVPQALTSLGVRKIFHKIAQRPGKPFWFGLSPKGQPVFALPGNPVSALACCSRHVVPALLRAQGLVQDAIPVRLGETLSPLPSMTRLVPVQLVHGADGVATAIPHPMPTSGDFNRLGMTQGLVTLSPGTAPLMPGASVLFHEW
ncbi:molybdopterin molybdotransferase MoeA [Asaia spathodeae]|uniref:molybdopterin molybdotransferase MoeA n=1 Tax=Asaia spathodeae TaxID=657016 RepID=UPI002FC3BA13